MERLESGKNQMTQGIIKTKRVALAWDPEFKPAVDDLRNFLTRKGDKKAPTNAELFMLCLGIGFDKGITRKTPPRNSDAIRIEAFKDSNLLAIMQSVALAHSGDYTILMDEDKVFDIVESYAAAGLEILSIEMVQQHDFLAWLSALLYLQAKNSQIA